MRFRLGAPPTDPLFEPQRGGWKKLREPSPIAIQFVALPVAVAMAAVLIPAWSLVRYDGWSPVVLDSLLDENVSMQALTHALAVVSALVVGMLVGGPTLVLAHELLHAIGFPGGLQSERIIIGLWPRKLLCYAWYAGPIGRNRFLWVYVLPLLVLTGLPLFVALVVGHSHIALAVVSVLNGICSCGDLVGMALITWQVPSSATLRNVGWETWWKREG